MRSVLLALGTLLAACAGLERAPTPADAERPEWNAAFEAEGGRGVFVLLDPAMGRTERSDRAAAAERHLPASTFKLYNALVALDAGVATDPDSVFVWDGTERSIPSWNRDHSLRTGMAASTVWLYQRVAARVGRERFEAAFAREPYGTGTLGDDVETFWLDGSLRISADEQVRFADRLRSGRAAFSAEAQATVRDLATVFIERDGVRVVGKTGWGVGGFDGQPTERETGWVVGWVERPGVDRVFALRVAPARAGFEMGPARLRILEAILVGEGLIPPSR